jgi:hypothetical protein
MNDNKPKQAREYVVGYGKPPSEYQFKKGQSGNPSGRRKKVPDKPRSSDRPTQGMLLYEAYRPVMVREGEKIIELPAIQAVFRAMGVAALKGNRFAQKALAELVQKVEQDHRDIQYANLEAFTDYKVQLNREIERCKRLGLPDPEPLPHPDDVIIDYRQGTFRIAGPITKEEKATWDKMIERRDEAQSEIIELTGLIKEDPKYAVQYREEREWTRQIFDMINDKLPERYQVNLLLDDGDSQEGQAA